MHKLKVRLSWIPLLLCLASSPLRAGVDQVLSLQSNGAGAFSALCEDHSVAVATADDVRGDRVCTSELGLETGRYQPVSPLLRLCGQWVELSKANSRGERALTIRYLDACAGNFAHLSCAHEQCAGFFDDNRLSPISVTIKDRTHYLYKGTFGEMLEFVFVDSGKPEPASIAATGSVRHGSDSAE